jgi:diketogulonate reductase-like aldo/keto reductase
MTDAFIVDGNGAQIPARGFGTFQLRGDVCRTAVRAAIGAGYRHVDTASMYGNEVDVGEGLRNSGVARDELFVTTKVWTDDIAEDDLLVSAQASLQRLGLAQVNLLLIHWPNRDIPLESSMRGLCRARKEGFARHIGVSNFPVALLDRAVRLAAGHGEKLSVNQCEFHPRLDQSKVMAACRAYQMAFTSYSPLGRGDLVRHATVEGLAEKLGRKPSQVILRWHLQQGVVAIPRSSTPAHIAENFDLDGFELSDTDMAAMSALQARDGRLVMPAFAPDWDV